MQISHLSGSAEEKRMTFWRNKLTKLLSTIMGGDVVSICVCVHTQSIRSYVCVQTGDKRWTPHLSLRTLAFFVMISSGCESDRSTH